MPAEDANFGPRLKELRAAAGLTQEELADKSRLSLGTVRALEQRAYDPTWPTIKALAAALGVECGAFTVKAREVAPPKVGRPPKGSAPPPAKKAKGRRRPRG